MFKDICREFGNPLISLFTTRANAKLPVYMSPVPDPMAWKKDAFQHDLGQSHCLCLPSIHSSKTDPVKSYDLSKPFHDLRSAFLDSERMVCPPSFTPGGHPSPTTDAVGYIC